MPDVNELVEAIRAALHPQAPPPELGWHTLHGLMQELDASESAVRRRLHALGDKIERKRIGGSMYYRMRNGHKP